MMWTTNKEMGSSMCLCVGFHFGEECGLVECCNMCIVRCEAGTSTYFPKEIIHMHYNKVLFTPMEESIGTS